MRKKAQTLVALIKDKDRIREVRNKAAANRDKYALEQSILNWIELHFLVSYWNLPSEKKQPTVSKICFNVQLIPECLNYKQKVHFGSS